MDDTGTGGGPVFLHGLWRSGSTYVWSCFRRAHGAYGYFEPVYPGLAKLTPARIARADWRVSVADNRHPELDAPYYDEYAPLLRRRGVRGFQRRFAFDRFALAQDDAHAQLQSYFNGLIGHAAGLGRRAVLGCNRTWLRTAWLKARFGGFHVHVERDPMAIWSSYTSHAAQGNFSYFNNLHRIVERNAAHPLFEGMASRLWLRRGLDRMRKPARFYADAFAAMSAEESYELVYFMWLLAALHGLGACDVVVDSCLAGRAGYAAELEARIARGCGLELDLSALRRMAPRVQADFDRQGVETRVRDALPPAVSALWGDPHRARRRLHRFAPAKAEQLDRVIGRLSPPGVRIPMAA